MQILTFTLTFLLFTLFSMTACRPVPEGKSGTPTTTLPTNVSTTPHSLKLPAPQPHSIMAHLEGLSPCYVCNAS